MSKIVFLDGYSLGDSSLSAIEKLGELTVYEETFPCDVVERSKDADIIITNKVKIFKDEIDRLPNLKLICVAATGVNNVDVQYAESRGIVVSNVAGYSTSSVTEATLSFVLGLLRQVPHYNTFVESGRYAAGTRCFNLDRPISEVRGKKWGVVGMGAIGRGVAAVASAMGAEVCYYSTSGANLSQGYPCVSFEELLATCDIITIHSPLNDKTNGLFNAEAFAQMKSSAILVNVGRGFIVDEVALADALNSDKIAGAALDVFSSEPISPENPLLNLRDPYKFISAPHCGWASSEARSVLVAGVASNIANFLG